MSELPHGWTSVRLADIVKSRKGKKPSRLYPEAAKGRHPYILIDEMEGHPARYYTDDEKVPVASKEDILVVWDGSIGKCAYGLTGAIGSTIVALTPLGIEPGLLEAFIRRSRVTIQKTSRGSGLQHINQGVFWELDVPLPPLKEQHRIISKLKKVLGKLESSQKRLEKIPVVLKRFRQSILAAACSGRLTADWREESGRCSATSLLGDISERRKKLWTEQRKAKGFLVKPTDYPEPVKTSGEFGFDAPETWEQCSMDALTSAITSGSRDWKQYYQDEGTGTFIMAQNVRPLCFDRSYRLAVAPPQNNSDRTRSQVFKDDLLVTIVGANTGDSCRVPEELCEHYVCQSVALMRPVFPETSPYLELFLNSSGHGLAQYKKWIYGEGRPHLSFDHLREMLVCLPPLFEQQEITRRVKNLFALADQIEARFQKAQAKVEKLTPSILVKAFRGELVPQDPTDEPASVLLERIRRKS